MDQLLMPTRQEVYSAIDSELASFDRNKTVDQWLMELKFHFLSIADPGQYALPSIRELAALCVACMEEHGSYLRNEDGTRGPFVPGPLVRGQVHTIINTERNYQCNLPTTRTDGRPHTVCGFLCMFDTYLRLAIDGWTNNPGTDEALDNIRKLAGICVHCMEKHGAPHRE